MHERSGFDAGVVGRIVLDAASDRSGHVSSLDLDLDTGVVAFAGVAMLRRGRRRLAALPQLPSRAANCLPARTVGPPRRELPVGAEADLFAQYDQPNMPAEPSGGRRLVPYI